MDDRPPGMIDDLPGQLGLAIGDGERPHGQPAVANLVPVMNGRRPAASRFINLQTWLQSFVHDSLPDLRPVGVGENRVKPVVADRQRIGHLGDVEEVAGIPVRERRGREHLTPGAIGLAVVAIEPVEARKSADPPQRGAALIKQPGTDQAMDCRRLLDHLLRVFLEPVVPPLEPGIGLDLLFEDRDVVVQDVKPRMTGT